MFRLQMAPSRPSVSGGGSTSLNREVGQRGRLRSTENSGKRDNTSSPAEEDATIRVREAKNEEREDFRHQDLVHQPAKLHP